MDGVNSGIKMDSGKTRWDLLPLRALNSIAEILTVTIKENGGDYDEDSWRWVPNGVPRYFSAMMRHWFRMRVWGEVLDEKTGKPHRAHFATNALIICELLEEEQEGRQ